jgi:hypothetical protein
MFKNSYNINQEYFYKIPGIQDLQGHLCFSHPVRG